MNEGEIPHFKRPYALSFARTRVLQNVKKESLAFTSLNFRKTTTKPTEKNGTPLRLDKKCMSKPPNQDNIRSFTHSVSPRVTPQRPHHARTTSNQIQVSSLIQPKSMTPAEVIENFSYHLTDFEKREINIYKKIYFFGPNAAKQKGNFTDASGNFIVRLKDHISFRYEICEILGSGSFGQVLKCFDHKDQQNVAIKIIKSHTKFRKSGESEYKILKHLTSTIKEETNIIKPLKKLEFRGHFCIVTELLYLNLYQFIETNDFQPININIVKRITTQLLIALSHMHSNNIIHCDLKPENILLKNSSKSSIRVIDLGSACFKSSTFFSYIQSRFYRAPEIILQCEYNEKIDIWSLGCIVFELLTGNVLFDGNNEHEQIYKITNLLGFPPLSIVEKVKKKHNYSFQAMKGISRISLRNILKNYSEDVVDFIESCLTWDYEERISAKDGLKTQWIRGHHARSSSETLKIVHDV
ncbi:hypothetical protein SteCoe_1930 [Stentor coeruleus]|uniref:dual-specificity kinase n=1 Tax=Stentor coeruleus TaxID=5963 RepID=A0A1R2D0J5_9CILI|nr:hypothetical protein SteCoe_1930 [Stentor coeruleus]